MKELSEKSFQDLARLLAEKRENVRVLRFQASVGQLKQVRAIRGAKRDIAHIMTAMSGLRNKVRS